MTGSAQSGGDDGAGLLFVFLLALLVPGLPLGAACLIRRRAKASGRDTTKMAIAVGLAEPAWLLLMWSWLTHGALWPAAVALLLPVGYAGYVRRRAQFQ